VGSIGDKLRVLGLVRRARRGTLEDLYERAAKTTREALAERGFSERMTDRFFRPFLGGVFLDPGLATSSRMMEFVLRMFAEGSAALPAGGMGAIPEQIAAGLPAGTVRTGVTVTGISARTVETAGGEEIAAEAVVVATDGPMAAELLPGLPRPAFRGVTCLYFSAGEAPIRDPVLLLDGEGRGPVTNLCFPSRVAEGYAPEGRELVSATVLDPTGADGEELEAAVRAQLRGWFGPAVDGWQHLRTCRIPEALPVQTPEVLDPVVKAVRHESGVYLCGDHRETGSIQGAMSSGRRAAEAVLEESGGSPAA
jgi:phytoene dehydrogenase-like protein